MNTSPDEMEKEAQASAQADGASPFATEEIDGGVDAVEAGGEGVANNVSQLKKERDELFERLARSTAEFQNSRKRLEADAQQRVQYANTSLIKSLLPVLDNLERALAVDAKVTDAATLLSGVKLVADQFAGVLKNQQVEIIAPAAGDAFDPATHEAIMHQPSDLPEGSVSLLVEKGYTLQGRVLRAAKVALAKPKG